MSNTGYCYPNSDILINKLNIRNGDILCEAEKRLTMLRISDLFDRPIQGMFDLKHLQNIHKHMFQDVYEWAGKIHTVDIAKGNMFCKVQFITVQAEEIFAKLKKENDLSSLDPDELGKKMAYYFSEINALHPFRDGNGRSQREFIREWALSNGYRIDFRYISGEQMLEASKDSFLCDYGKMEELFLKCLNKI